MLTDFHDLTIDAQLAILAQMLADRRDDEAARARRYVAQIPFTLSAAPAPPPVDHPLDRAAVSTFSEIQS